MREIKFRAWDKSYRALHYAVDMFTLEEPMAAYELGEKSRYIFMQYTGLKDKNSKEIYEGDIVEHPHAVEPCVVSFDYNKYVIQEIEEPHGTAQIFETWKVIGNIYENPELIERGEK